MFLQAVLQRAASIGLTGKRCDRLVLTTVSQPSSPASILTRDVADGSNRFGLHALFVAAVIAMVIGGCSTGERYGHIYNMHMSQWEKRAVPWLPYDSSSSGCCELVGIWFVTDRKPETLRQADPKDDSRWIVDFSGEGVSQVSWGVCDVRVFRRYVSDAGSYPAVRGMSRPTAEPPPSEDATDRESLSEQYMPSELVDALANSTGAGGARPTVLLFVPGYNMSFERTVVALAQIVVATKFSGIPIAFSWPSPKNALLYFADRERAVWSAPKLTELLEYLTRKPGIRVIVVAHSTGAHILAEALARMSRTKKDGVWPIEQVLLAAPDVNHELFIDRDADLYQNCVQRTTVYVGRKDRPLALSSWLRGGGERTGWISRRTGHPLAVWQVEEHIWQQQEPEVQRGRIDFVDVTRAEGGHSSLWYGRQVIHDVTLLLEQNRSPRHRLLNRREERPRGITYWEVNEDQVSGKRRERCDCQRPRVRPDASVSSQQASMLAAEDPPVPDTARNGPAQ